MHVGERIKRYRRRRGLAQTTLAHMVGRSESWLSQIERGVRSVDRFSTVLELSRVLNVEVVELTGRKLSLEPKGMHYNAIAKIRLALVQYDSIPAAIHPETVQPTRPADPLRIRRGIDEANTLYQATRYNAVADLLPGVLVEAQRATHEFTGEERRAAYGLLAEVYQITAKTLTRIGEPSLGWLTIERSLAAAERAEDPLLMAASAYHLGQALRALAEVDDASNVTLNAVGALQRNERIVTPERQSAIGGLYLTAVMAAAVGRDGNEAARLLDHSAVLAEDIDDTRNDLWFAFGPTNVQIHRMAVATELGDVTEAIRIGESLDVSNLPPGLIGRRSAVLIDLARAYTMRRMDPAAVNTLLEAERIAPEVVHFNILVQGLLRELLRREHRASTPQLRDLASRAGLLE